MERQSQKLGVSAVTLGLAMNVWVRVAGWLSSAGEILKNHKCDSLSKMTCTGATARFSSVLGSSDSTF